MNVRVVGAGEPAEALRSALASVGLIERAGEPAAFVCTLDDFCARSPCVSWPRSPDPSSCSPTKPEPRSKPAPTMRAARRTRSPSASLRGCARQRSRASRKRPPPRQRARQAAEAADPGGGGRRGCAHRPHRAAPAPLRRRCGRGRRDGAEARRRAEPGLVLLDLFLPGMDGFGALTGLRRNSKTADTPVIFLSAQGDAETKSQGLSLGAADYLAKPFSEQELMARVDRTLKLAAQKEHFRALAQTDGLTGLPNFRSFHARLEEEVARAHRYGHPLACAMVDPRRAQGDQRPPGPCRREPRDHGPRGRGPRGAARHRLRGEVRRETSSSSSCRRPASLRARSSRSACAAG